MKSQSKDIVLTPQMRAGVRAAVHGTANPGARHRLVAVIVGLSLADGWRLNEILHVMRVNLIAFHVNETVDTTAQFRFGGADLHQMGRHEGGDLHGNGAFGEIDPSGGGFPGIPGRQQQRSGRRIGLWCWCSCLRSERPTTIDNKTKRAHKETARASHRMKIK